LLLIVSRSVRLGLEPLIVTHGHIFAFRENFGIVLRRGVHPDGWSELPVQRYSTSQEITGLLWNPPLVTHIHIGNNRFAPAIIYHQD